MGYLFIQDCVFAASNENMLNVGIFFKCATNLTALFSLKAFTATFLHVLYFLRGFYFGAYHQRIK